MVTSTLPCGLVRFSSRTPALPPATHTNSYALGERQLLLVDPAPSWLDEQQRWLHWVSGLVAAGGEPIAIVLTHHHPDHAGGAALLAQRVGLPLWAHALTARRLPRLPIARRLEDSEQLVLEGPVVQRWTVLYTPGHALGHLCLHEPERGWLVLGDMLATESPVLVESDDGDMQSYLEQLGRLDRLEARLALPGHGEPITHPHDALARTAARRAEREAKVLRALTRFGSIGATVDAILPLAYDDTPREQWPVAVFSLRAHLSKLVRDGAARLASDGERHIAG